MYVCMDGCMYACMYVCMYACMHVCMYVCLYACMYAYMYVCMHAFTPHSSFSPNGIDCFDIIFFHLLMDDELGLYAIIQVTTYLFVRISRTRVALHTCVTVTLVSNLCVSFAKCAFNSKPASICSLSCWLR
jgi:hypothetical protein